MRKTYLESSDEEPDEDEQVYGKKYKILLKLFLYNFNLKNLIYLFKKGQFTRFIPIFDPKSL